MPNANVVKVIVKLVLRDNNDNGLKISLNITT
jgi:hypothetical protein